MKYLMALAIIASIMTGCATAPMRMDQGIDSLQGQKFDTAVNILGDPSRMVQMSSYTIYHWDAAVMDTVIRPGSSQWDEQHRTCSVSAKVVDDVITESNWTGWYGACKTFTKAFDKQKQN